MIAFLDAAFPLIAGVAAATFGLWAAASWVADGLVSRHDARCEASEAALESHVRDVLAIFDNPAPARERLHWTERREVDAAFATIPDPFTEENRRG